MLSMLAAGAMATAPPGPELPRRASTEQPVASYFHDDDYPPRPLREGVEGTVQFQVDVGTTGRPTRCLVVETSGNSELDTRTCAIVMERMRFKAAVDGAGRPMPDTLTSRVVWRVEDSPFQPFARRRAVTTMAPGPGGVICSVQVDEEPQSQLSARECVEYFGPDFVEEARRGSIFTSIDTFLPAGAAPFPLPDSRLGVRIGRIAIDIELDASGRTSACRVVAFDPGDPAFDPCTISDQKFEPAADGQVVRSARITGDAFVSRPLTPRVVR